MISINLADDLRYAVRMIRKTPGASAIAVLSLALGIGANTAIFSLVDTMLLKLLPVRSPQELYQLVTGDAARYNTSWNYPDYVALRDRNRAFTGLAAAGGTQPMGMQLVDSPAGAPTELVSGTMVSGNYFDVLGVGPALGQLFNTELDRTPGAAPYAVLNYEYWQSRFQGDPRIIGRKLRLNGYPFTILGVTREGFRSTDISQKPEIYIPLMMRSEIIGRPFSTWNNRHNFWFSMIGRIRPGTNLKQAESELLVIYKAQEEGERREAKDQRNVNPASPVTLLPGSRGFSGVRNRLKEPLVVLMIVVGLVLVIACANVANLMLARGAARQREIAVRLAVGASRGRLAAQLLTESIVLALVGGAAGLAVAYGGVQVLLGYMPQNGGGQASLAVAPDWRLLAFAAGLSVLTGMLFGLAPALASTRPQLVTALKEDTPGAGSSRYGLRNILVVVQVSLSLLLVIGASLFLRSLDSLRSLETGFRPNRTVVAFVDAGRNGYKGQRLRDFYERLLTDIKAIPGVQSASLADITPLEGSRWNGRIAVEGYTPKPKERMIADMNAVGPRFFETLGITLLAGREFRNEDNPTVSEEIPPGVNFDQRPMPPGARVATVNESFVKKYFAGRNPIGMHVCLDEKYDATRAFEIVGVVKDARYFGLRRDTETMVYQPVWRPGPSSKSVSIRTTQQSPAGLGDAIRRAVTALDPNVPLLNLRSIEQQIDNNILEDRLLTTLSGFLGGLALLLAAVGLYGVVSFAVTRRTREIGIRMALGAERPSVVWLVGRYAAALVICGALIGVPTALLLSKMLKSFLFGIAPQDPAAIIGAVLTLAAAAALACYVPAMRATKVDPMVALRHD